MMSSMNPRERILAAINHQPVDRIPTDIWATGEVWDKLRVHFGEGVDILNVLHIDGFDSPAPARYLGPALPECQKDESVNYWGIRTKQVGYETGSYAEQSYYPLAEAQRIDDLEKYRWPQADWFDYSQMHLPAKGPNPHRAISCGYMAIFYLHNQLRGLEQSLLDPLDNPEFTHHLLGRMADFLYEHHLRMFQACDGFIDTAQVTDDYGSQTGPMISLETFREFYKPHMKRFINLCHGFGIKVFHHDDGAMSSFLPDLVEMGIDILNPIQWTCPGMEREGLKQKFGGRVCFHGAVENQRILPFGTTEEVRREVRDCINFLAGDGTGYILAPCHNLQANTPVENIIAMYDEAWNYGKRK